MKQHTTNYYSTLITVAEDTKAIQGTAPAENEKKKTIANWQFDLLARQPAVFTSDDVLFSIYVTRNDLTNSEHEDARRNFFSKGQPCLRTSPLAKIYGWGILSDSQGKVRLVDSASNEYSELLKNNDIVKVPAMKSKK